MKHNKIFLWAALATLSMTSCGGSNESSAQRDNKADIVAAKTEEPIVVNSEEALKNAIANKESGITIGDDSTLTSDLKLDYPVTISGTPGKTITTTAPIKCTGDVIFQNLTIDATTPRGISAIYLEKEGISVVLKSVNFTQHVDGPTDGFEDGDLSIRNVTGNNTLDNSYRYNTPSVPVFDKPRGLVFATPNINYIPKVMYLTVMQFIPC